MGAVGSSWILAAGFSTSLGGPAPFLALIGAGMSGGVFSPSLSFPDTAVIVVETKPLRGHCYAAQIAALRYVHLRVQTPA
jgi:hypothetical protein